MTMKNTNPSIHVRFDGRSYDLDPAALGLRPASADADVHEALARHFEVPLHTFRSFVVERHRNGSVTVRPEAVFG